MNDSSVYYVNKYFNEVLHLYILTLSCDLDSLGQHFWELYLGLFLFCGLLSMFPMGFVKYQNLPGQSYG